MIMEQLMILAAGIVTGVILVLVNRNRQKRKLKVYYENMLRMAKSELDDAESRIEELHKELAIKQNVIDSQNKRINRQLRIINRHKNGGSDVQGNTQAPDAQ